MNKLLLVLVGLLTSIGIHANELHPAFPLLDQDGQLVVQSKQPFSAVKTCGECHDTAFIADSSDHAAAGVFGDDEPDCLVCHSDAAENRSWAPESFNPDGSLESGILVIRKPRDENCAQCHGLVSNELEVPLTINGDPGHRGMTERTGQIISPQKVSNSGLNIAGKKNLTHAFDVHADRVVGCVNCHYSLNNPVYFQQRRESRPPHLDFDPRRLTSADYLTRPSHQLAKGSSENSMRRCESCHDATQVHQWLPYKRGHFAALACESCHVPKMYGPALQTLDQTLVNAQGRPLRHYRDVEGDPTTADSLIHGFSPAVLVRENVGGERKLAPFNLVTNWFWTAGSPPQQVAEEQLFEVLYADGRLDPELQRLLDNDSNGSLDEKEFHLESDAAMARVRQLLEQAGHDNVKMSGEVTPYSISHGVVNGQWAIRECRTCHGADSVLGETVTLSEFLPGGKLPEMTRHAGIGAGGLINFSADGSAWFQADPSAEGFYVLGFSGLDLVDLAGLAMFLGISLGVTGHALARYMANRRRPRTNGATRKVHMYDAYERIWHWLQASAILLLIFTGLVIHKPHLFGMFSFEYIVQVHNVLGFILLINAALALFYTLASGTIKRFFPEKDNFFGRAFEQAMFYSKGIFAGDAHPLEKTKQNRLNPLQQITYLAILNILLPAQVITGVLIWGMQEWPQLAAALGGLPVLAPIHTFLAWAFSAFIVMHVYLTTTGETPLSGIKSMISGWEDVEEHHGNTDSAKETAHV